MLRIFLTLLIVLVYNLTLSAQVSTSLAFGTDSTLEIVSWNIEHFPKNGSITIDYVKAIIEEMDADVIAFQEIDDTIAFKVLINQLPDYHYYFLTSWYAGLAFAYKHDEIEINDLFEVYTSSQYWSPFPRSPKVMDMNFDNQNFVIINNHFKCCGDGYLNLSNTGDEETRRFIASNLLKDYIDTFLPNRNVFLVGDLNDNLMDPPSNNVFSSFINDNQNFVFADMGIASGSSTGWSYPTWPSHLDHILITNELFDDMSGDGSEIRALKIEEYLTNGWSEYESNVSDHRPLAIKIVPNAFVGVKEIANEQMAFSNFPNPLTTSTLFTFNHLTEDSKLLVTNSFGITVRSIALVRGSNNFDFFAGDLEPGMYIAQLMMGNRLSGTVKLVVLE